MNKITAAHVKSKIQRVSYGILPDTTFVTCAITLENGYIVTGESACADPSIFDVAKGKDLARAEAERKIWNLEGYLLREYLHQAEQKPKTEKTDRESYCDKRDSSKGVKIIEVDSMESLLDLLESLAAKHTKVPT